MAWEVRRLKLTPSKPLDSGRSWSIRWRSTAPWKERVHHSRDCVVRAAWGLVRDPAWLGEIWGMIGVWSKFNPEGAALLRKAGTNYAPVMRQDLHEPRLAPASYSYLSPSSLFPASACASPLLLSLIPPLSPLLSSCKLPAETLESPP